MNSKDRIELFLRYQEQNMSFEDISNELGIKSSTLRRSLNKNGYKSEKGIYVKYIDESQISFEGIKDTKKSSKSNRKGNNNKNEINKSKIFTCKKDNKINITQEDIDKLCEVYDWYVEVKDNKALKPKKLSSKKDVLLDKTNTDDFKSVNIRVDKQTWEDFERLCSNSSFNKKEIITQALKDFMKTYKNLL